MPCSTPFWAWLFSLVITGLQGPSFTVCSFPEQSFTVTVLLKEAVPAYPFKAPIISRAQGHGHLPAQPTCSEPAPLSLQLTLAPGTSLTSHVLKLDVGKAQSASLA